MKFLILVSLLALVVIPAVSAGKRRGDFGFDEQEKENKDEATSVKKNGGVDDLASRARAARIRSQALTQPQSQSETQSDEPANKQKPRYRGGLYGQEAELDSADSESFENFMENPREYFKSARRSAKVSVQVNY